MPEVIGYDTRMEQKKENHWKKIITDYESSGLSQRAYCEKKELRLSTFQYWRKRIKDNFVGDSFLEIPFPSEESNLAEIFHLSISRDGYIRLKLNMPASEVQSLFKR
jgi:hypothetical protein